MALLGLEIDGTYYLSLPLPSAKLSPLAYAQCTSYNLSSSLP